MQQDRAEAGIHALNCWGSGTRGQALGTTGWAGGKGERQRRSWPLAPLALTPYFQTDAFFAHVESWYRSLNAFAVAPNAAGSPLPL